MRWPATALAEVRWCGLPMRSFSTIRTAEPQPEPGGPEGRPIGIMGGTYDPVHNGHLAAARQLRDEAAFESVWLVPNAHPPHRSAAPAASAEDRMRMVELAARDRAGLTASRIEVDRGGLSYTIDTVRELARSRPGRRLGRLLGSALALPTPAWPATHP